MGTIEKGANMSRKPPCGICGSRGHETGEHRPFYDDTSAERQAWLRGWQVVRCGGDFPAETSPKLRRAFNRGKAEAEIQP